MRRIVGQADYIAEANVQIRSAPKEIWDALTDPERIETYTFGAQVETDWKVGRPITWRGEWKGKEYEDKGEILEFEPHRHLSYSHYSALSGEPDLPENYHTVSIGLTPVNGATQVTLTQDNNDNEEARDHSQKNWSSMLEALKEHVEVGG